jgi:hypothetical protein
MSEQAHLRPSVYIVVLNWNNAADTLACLGSLSQLDYPHYTTLVVDNGSTDGSADIIRAHYAEVTILEAGINLGYAEGNNVGIRHALSANAEYVFVLNNDTLVAPNLLSELIRVAETAPQTGMLGPTMYCDTRGDTLFAAGSFIRWTRGETHNRGMFQPAARYAHLKQPEPVDYIAGCGVLVRKELLITAGGLDASYYLNFEDAEWGMRARRYGFGVWYVPQAAMWHKVSASLGQASPANTYYMTRNRLRFFWQNAPAALRCIAVTRVLLRILRTTGAWSTRRAYRNARYRRLRRAQLLGLRDFLHGRCGEMGPDVARVCYSIL